MEFSVFAKDVKEGDEIRYEYGSRVISNVHVGRDIVFLEYQKDGITFAIRIKPTEGVTVLYRPWPEGKKEFNMLGEITGLMPKAPVSQGGTKEEWVRWRDAINAYLMGLKEPEQGELFPSDPPVAGGTCDSSVTLR